MTRKKLIYLTILILLIGALILTKPWNPVSAFYLGCKTCINFSALPTSIWRGESSTLTLILDNQESAPAYAYCTITNPDGSKIIDNQKLNDGTYNYTVWPGGGNPGNFTYTASCTGGGGTPTDSVIITVNNKVPNVPTLIAPPNNVWITYEPTFEADVPNPADPEGDQVKVCFDLDSNGSCEYWSGFGGPGRRVSWSTTVPDTTGRSWRAKTEDSFGASSPWSGSWTLKKDTTPPFASIDQENGISLDTSIWVNLTESDATSGVAEGDVDVRKNGGSWVNTDLPNGGSTIDDFIYEGQKGSTYEFRYRVKDNVDWWSDWAYDGSVRINTPPDILSTWEIHWYCETDSRAITFNWEYFDADNDPQVSYQVQIKGGVWDTGEVSSSSESYTLPDPTILEWDKNYTWRVRVKDEPGSWSNWANDAFWTPKHQYPDCEFSWSPEYPNAYDEDYPDAPDTAVQFTDESTAYGGASIISWSWTFQDGDPATSSLKNPLVKFLSEGDKAVTLEACDSDGYCCPEEKSIYVNFPLPEWKERIPR